MKRLIPLMFLGLTACTTSLEALYPPRVYTYVRDAKVYFVRAQYDPFQRGWFARVSPREGRFEQSDRNLAAELVQSWLGPEVCRDKDPLEVKPGKVWTRFDAPKTRYLAEDGIWQFVARCA